MIRFPADADLHHGLVLAVRGKNLQIDIASAADSGIQGLEDPEVLDRAALQDRILITHDRNTMTEYFRRRIGSGDSSPGLLVVSQFAPFGPVVESLCLIWADENPAQWLDRIHRLPSLRVRVFAR